MQLHSTDEKCRILVLPTEYQGERCFQVSASIKTGQSEALAVSHEVDFFNTCAFLDLFDRFILDRSLRPRLTGTDDTTIEFFRPETPRNTVFLRVTIGDTRPDSETAFRFQAAFEIDQSALTTCLAELRDILPDS